MAEIIVKFDDQVIEQLVVNKKLVTIGRTEENDITLANRGVSRKHAIMKFVDDEATITDNESLNGTFVNDRRITEIVLKDEDVITIGKYSLVYRRNAPEPPDETVGPGKSTLARITKGTIYG